MSRAKYEWCIYLEGPVLFIKDTGRDGHRSVTNDMENVLTEIAYTLFFRNRSYLIDYHILFADSEGEIDGVRITHMGDFSSLIQNVGKLIHGRATGKAERSNYVSIDFFFVRNDENIDDARREVLTEGKYHHSVDRSTVKAVFFMETEVVFHGADFAAEGGERVPSKSEVVTRLKEALKQAEQAEDYNACAQIRDQIKRIENEKDSD